MEHSHICHCVLVGYTHSYRDTEDLNPIPDNGRYTVAWMTTQNAPIPSGRLKNPRGMGKCSSLRLGLFVREMLDTRQVGVYLCSRNHLNRALSPLVKEAEC